MKKFNKEMYKEIKTKGEYNDQYYKYILIDKKYIFKGWKTSNITTQEYKFFGVLDTRKKDIYTEQNIKTIQWQIIDQAKKELQTEIQQNKEQYKEIQKENFEQLLKSDDFKNRISYYFYDYFTSHNFLQLYVLGITPNELEKQQYQKLIDTKQVLSNELFFKKYLEEKKENIFKEFKDYFTSDNFLDEWGFNYKWNNDTKINLHIKPTFKNNISLKINEIDYIIENYKELYNNPSEELKKIKKLYNECKLFFEQNDNKTCKIVLNNKIELKVLDFKYLITILESGQSKHACYRLFTNNELKTLEDFNEQKGRGTRETDIFPSDITKIVYSNKIIFADRSGADEK